VKATDEEIERVFESWRARQKRPERVRLTRDRRTLIRRRIESGHTVDDLLAVIRYAFEAETPEARFWRGENNRGAKYLGLDNLFRVGKVSDRVDRALDWLDDLDEQASDEERGVVIDLVGMLRRQARGRHK
jgi:hypothetical protein